MGTINNQQVYDDITKLFSATENLPQTSIVENEAYLEATKHLTFGAARSSSCSSESFNDETRTDNAIPEPIDDSSSGRADSTKKHTPNSRKRPYKAIDFQQSSDSDSDSSSDSSFSSVEDQKLSKKQKHNVVMNLLKSKNQTQEKSW